MRIVFLTPSPSMSPRSLGFLTELCRRHAVTVIAACHSATDLAATGRLLALGARVVQVSVSRNDGWRHHEEHALGTDPARPTPADSQIYNALRAELAREDVGVVHVTGLPAPYLRQLRVPVVWDADVCHSRLLRLNLAQSARPPRRRVRERAIARMEAYERSLVEALPTITVSSEREREALLALLSASQTKQEDYYEASDGAAEYDEEYDDDDGRYMGVFDEAASLIRRPHISLLSHGVDLEEPAPYDARRHYNRLVARLDGRAPLSRVALEWLAESIMPRIWELRPDARLTLLCDELPHKLHRFASDGRVSVVTGAAESRTYVVGAAVALVPLPEAAGLQDTLLEPLSAGTPVIATWAALGGVTAVPGRDLLVAGDADEFARHVAHVLDDEFSWRTLARNGRAYVERAHSWRLAVHQLETIYSDASGFDFVGLAATPKRALSLRERHATAH